jgi:hypothetical protein
MDGPYVSLAAVQIRTEFSEKVTVFVWTERAWNSEAVSYFKVLFKQWSGENRNPGTSQDILTGTPSEAGISRRGEGTAVLEHTKGFICTETVIKTRRGLGVSMSSAKTHRMRYLQSTDTPRLNTTVTFRSIQRKQDFAPVRTVYTFGQLHMYS